MAARKYNWHGHDLVRKALLPKAWGTPCPFCGKEMIEGQSLDLDHSAPIAIAGMHGGPLRMAHSRCNRQAGGRLGYSRRFGGRGQPGAPLTKNVTSRTW